MTYSKSHKFEDDVRELAKIAKALSHPARLAILKFLSESKTCISGDISNEIPLSRTTVSQHLQELKKAGLIMGEVEGVKVNYCICHDAMIKVKELFEGLFTQICCVKDSNCDC